MDWLTSVNSADLVSAASTQFKISSPIFCRRLVLDTPFLTKSTVSYGLIVYALNTQRWALVQRKHSVEFLLFIKGHYRATHLPILLSCITEIEAQTIKECLIDLSNERFCQVFLNELGFEVNELDYAITRLEDDRAAVSSLLEKLNVSTNQLKWTWPKGRMSVQKKSFSKLNRGDVKETPFECALREFTEEVEIILPPPVYISNTYLGDNIRTITGRNIESRYWIYVIAEEIPMTPPLKNPEVSNRQWFDTKTCGQNVQHETFFRQVVEIVRQL